MPIAASVQRSLGRMLAERQVDWRVPGLAAGVVRDGILGWSGGVGAVDVTHPEVPPDGETQYRIGSITKTFTAALVMALRDDGRLDLDDRLTRFCRGPSTHRSPFDRCCRTPRACNASR